MPQIIRWLIGGCSAIELEDGRRASLDDLLNAARRTRSRDVRRLIGAGRARLTVLARRLLDSAAGRRKRRFPRVGLMCAFTSDYRSDAALGHMAGQVPHSPLTARPGTHPEPSTKIAA